jgi:imidazoleglycerol phosphate synthase glutamine amidotransferase subunit HisH
MVCSRGDDIVATVNYGKEIVAVAGRENILGVQFHPEKSQKKQKKPRKKNQKETRRN